MMAFCPKGHVKTTFDEVKFVSMEEGRKDKAESLLVLDKDEGTPCRVGKGISMQTGTKKMAKKPKKLERGKMRGKKAGRRNTSSLPPFRWSPLKDNLW